MNKEFTGTKLFLNIPTNISRDKELLKKPKSIILMGEIISMLNVTGEFFMSNKRIAERLDCSPRMVRDYLDLLESKKLIERKNVYDEKNKNRIVGRKILPGSYLGKQTSIGYGNALPQGREADFRRVGKQTSTKKNNIKEQLIEQKNKGAEDKLPKHPPYKEIISYLNEKTGKKYKYASKSNQSMINARFNEGYELEDFKKVIDKKVTDWASSEKMNQYLRPRTLFGTKFEDYLNEDIKANSKTKPTYDFSKAEWQETDVKEIPDDELPF